MESGVGYTFTHGQSLTDLLRGGFGWVICKEVEMKTIVVIAGTQKEFRAYLLEKSRVATDYKISANGNPSEIDSVRYLYAHSVETLRGLRNVSFEFYGLCDQRPDFEELKAHAVMLLQSEGQELPWELKL